MREALIISSNSKADRFVRHPKVKASQLFPTLMRLGLGRANEINQGIKDIFSAAERGHERLIFFELNPTDLITLPSPIVNAAICERIFEHIWQSCPDKASKIVGKSMEAALAKACVDKAPTVLNSKVYSPEKGKILDMDVVGREEDRITLIETKAKSLTNRSRQSGGFTYIADYTKSYLALIKQLMVHERYIREGKNPIVIPGEYTSNLRPLKVAVSPLSFGQLSDKVFASGMLAGLFNVTLTSVTGRDSKENIDVIDAFNKSFLEAKNLMIELAPKENGVAQIVPYMIDFFWVDLGQALYVMDRATSISNAFQPLKHITYSSRDFWTEVATADRGGLTRDRWRPVSTLVTPAASP